MEEPKSPEATDEGDLKIEEAPSEDKVPEEQVFIDIYTISFHLSRTLTTPMNPKTQLSLPTSLMFQQLTRVPIAVVETPTEDKGQEQPTEV